MLRGETPVKNEEVTKKYEKIPSIIEAFSPVIEENLSVTDPVKFRSWECLSFYAKLCNKLSKVIYSASLGEKDELDKAWAAARDFACKNEMRFQKEFDVFEFILVWESKILNRIKEQEEMFIE